MQTIETNLEERDALLKSIGFSDEFIRKLNEYNPNSLDIGLVETGELEISTETIDQTQSLMVREPEYPPLTQLFT